MNELDPLDKRLNVAWQSLSPPVDLAARVRARLAGPPSLATGGAPAAPTLGGRVASRWRALRASGPLGAGAGALLLGVGIALGYLIPRAPVHAARPPEPSARAPAEAVPRPPSAAPIVPAPASSPPAATDAVARPSAAASPAPDSPAPDSPVPDSPAPDRSRSRREPAAPPRSRAHLAEAAPAATSDRGAELALLERAERAVRSKNPALALALIGELEQSFPRSPLHEERRSIELMAHCQAHGPSSDASADTKAEVAARRGRFVQRYPESVYSARIADECGALFSATPPTNRATPDIDGAEGGSDVQ